MIFERLRGRSERRKAAASLCHALSARARDEVFFRDFAVADTLDGRFDLLALHGWLVLDELERRRARALAQGVLDALFVQLEGALRDLGVGDMGLGRRMKAMASAFFGRRQAYRAAADETALAAAIARNLFRSANHALERSVVLARYANSARAHLVQSRLEQGEIDFGPLPDAVGVDDRETTP
ncbi:MAG TPA: ubiquinol-cytochrome C chaperone family protein [Rhizomicrobium sp.]|jgi:cytochrome b pre-mRNA-processing protein 3